MPRAANSFTPAADATGSAADWPARWRRLRTPLLLAGGVVAAGCAIALHNPNQPGSWLMCPLLATTGFYCPGCGTLRATHALLTGDPRLALAQNPLYVAFLPVFFVWWATAVRRAWLGVPKRWLMPAPVLYALPVVFAGYWVARNIPGITFLGPLS